MTVSCRTDYTRECLLYSLHCQRYTVALAVNLHDLYLDMLVELHHLCGVSDIAVGKLGDMHKTILMHADIYKGAEVGNVRHDTWQHHALDEVINGSDILVKLKFLDLLAWVASWFSSSFMMSVKVGIPTESVT